MQDDVRTPADPEQAAWFKLDVHPWVFFSSAVIIVLFVGITIFFENRVDNLFHQVQGAVSNYAGWFFVGTMNIFLIYVISLRLGRFGDFRLGGEGAKPEFSTLAWFAMLFSAGMGIGLLFYGVAEPMFHFVASPMAEPGTPEAARVAMDFTFLHWGLHPWSIYALVGLSLAFFAFNKGLPLSIRAVFHPLLGERIYGPIGNVIDIMATVATMFGVATSLGPGVQQVNAGLHHVFDVIPQSITTQLVLIAGITGLATWSVVRGLNAGCSECEARRSVALRRRTGPARKEASREPGPFSTPDCPDHGRRLAAGAGACRCRGAGRAGAHRLRQLVLFRGERQPRLRGGC